MSLVSLLDVNVLVALFDPEHLHHEHAHAWFASHRDEGWATCPITENGLVRVVSNPRYPGSRTTVEDIIGRLARFRRSEGHRFWPDSVSCTDADRLAMGQLQCHRQLTDAYLLALAVAHEGRLATFDRAVVSALVLGAGPEHLEILAS